jgi:hypothetical protein
VTPSLLLSAGLSLDAAHWEQTPLVVRQVVVQLLAVIHQQAVRIAALEARVSQNSSNSDRPVWSRYSNAPVYQRLRSRSWHPLPLVFCPTMTDTHHRCGSKR